VNLAILQEPRAAEGAGQRLPDVMRWDGRIERGEHSVIEDYEIFEGGRPYDPVEPKTTICGWAGQHSASGIMLRHHFLTCLGEQAPMPCVPALFSLRLVLLLCIEKDYL
jgi:hypothetical protein